MIKDYEEFWVEQSYWSQETFGSDSERGPAGPIRHLIKETREVISELGNTDKSKLQMELVDCFFLITDAARRSGLTYEAFMELVFKKLEINKSRKWGKPTTDQPVEHDRSGE